MKQEDSGRNDGQDRQTLVRGSATVLWIDRKAYGHRVMKDDREGGTRS